MIKYTLTFNVLIAKEKKRTQVVKCYLNVKLLFFPAAVMSNVMSLVVVVQNHLSFINNARE